MPKDDIDQEDPFELVGMALPGELDAAAVEYMGRCFIEEFVRMGWDTARILRLFREPFYRGPYAVYRARGERFVCDLIAQVQEEWNGGEP